MKLIRDNIPGMPEDAWKTVQKDEALRYLKLKLHEEVQELKESDYKSLDEFADVQEVLNDLIRKAKYRLSDVEVRRVTKLKERGSFTNKVLL